MLGTAKVHDLLAEPVPGTLVLVDRLWPRGVAKQDFAPDYWLKDVAPSPELRRWWGHNPDTFAEFARRYRAQLDANTGEDLRLLCSLADAALAAADPSSAGQRLLLVYAARDRDCNHALVLEQWLRENCCGE